MSDLYSISAAGAQDAGDILSLYEDDVAPGNPALLFTRRPDAWRSLQMEGEEVKVLLCRERATGLLIGMGACSINRCYVNGSPRLVAYLFGLKCKKSHRHRAGRMIVAMYEQFRRYLADKGIGCILTTVLSENAAARRLLAAPHSGKPDYVHIGKFDVFALATARLKKERFPDTIRRTCGAKVPREQLVDFFDGTGRKQNFFPVVNDARARPSDFFDKCVVLCDRDSGTIRAAGYGWDQRAYKQYIATGYRGIFTWARFFSPVTAAMGYPVFPSARTALDFATLSFAVIDGSNGNYFRCLLAAVASECANKMIMVGMGPQNPYREYVKTLPHFGYSSDLYAVTWKENTVEPPEAFGSPAYFECGRL
jgi:hypothetical protein